MLSHNSSAILTLNGLGMGQKFYLTPEGLKKIKEKYGNFKKVKFLKTQREFPQLLESEDLNPEYLSLQEDLSFLEAQIAEMEYILKNFQLIQRPARDKQRVVELGAKVLVEFAGQEQEFEVVGSLEADPVGGKISNESPVGMALLGHKVGDELAVNSSVNTIYKIKKIRYNCS